jgi:hypothetical protein
MVVCGLRWRLESGDLGDDGGRPQRSRDATLIRDARNARPKEDGSCGVAMSLDAFEVTANCAGDVDASLATKADDRET